MKELLLEYRNTTIGLTYLLSCCFIAYISQETIKDLAGVFIALGAGTTGVIGARGYNKQMENGRST